MSLRGKAAIVGIGELPTRRSYPGRSMEGLCAEAAELAIRDAGLRKEDIDGLVTEGGPTAPAAIADYLGIRPIFATGVTMMGASGATAVSVAAAAVAGGMCTTVLIVMGAGGGRSGARGAPQATVQTEFEAPFGPAAGATTGYALMKTRHMAEFGTTDEQLAKLAVDQRFNALTNENSPFFGQPITIEDVVNSRYISAPLHMLECVMPSEGAAACIVTTAERARSLPNRPVYILGCGVQLASNVVWQTPNIVETPAKISAAKAFEMAGYGPKDMQFAEFYDCYTVLVAMTLEDAGFVEKGEIGPFYQATDTTYKGAFPINTDGGQLSAGQPGLAGGFRHVIEAARQMMGKAGERQVAKNDLCMVNG